MSRTQNNELRNAMKNLRVDLPMKLKGGPNFQPPTPPGANAKEAPRSEVPPPQAPRIEDPRNQVPHSEVAPLKQTQVEQAESMPTGGFFKLSHNVFQEPLLRKLSGDCFRLFLWLSARGWRFPTSGGEVRASVRFMEDHTGMGHATISRSLKTLKEAGLLTLLETDFKRGNLWRVSSLACGGNRGPEDLPPRSEVPRNERAQKEITTTSKRESSSLKMRGELPQNDCNIRSIKKEINNSEEVAQKIQLNNENRQMESALSYFDAEVDLPTQQRLVEEFSLLHSTKHFKVSARVAKIMAACDWYRNYQIVTHKQISM